MIDRIITKYGLKVDQILPLQSGYRNASYPLLSATGSTINLIVHKSEPGMLARIRRTNQICDYLHHQDLPVRHIIDPRLITIRSGTKTRYAALYNYLPGSTIPWEAYTQDHIKLAGLVMSHLHAALKSAPANNLPSVANNYAAILGRVSTYFARTDVQQATRTKLGLTISQTHLRKLQKLLQICHDLPDQQPLHMDFVRGNLLFADASDHPNARFTLHDIALTGIIDFEKAAFGHPVFDIARTLAFLIVDCGSKSESQVRKYFLQSGYNKRGPAKLAQNRLLDELINLFLIHDFYKFLRHNPYEFLSQNHHFIRTRDTLIARGIIQ